MSVSYTEKQLVFTPIPKTTMEYLDRNHNRLAPRVYADLAQYGIPMQSRNGPVLRLPGVTTLVVQNPRERVNFCPVRDANPFFHLMEALAMLGGYNNAPFLGYFAKNMLSYSDDGQRYNAFYGERLRTTWGDQLDLVIKELAHDPASRQAVAQIWDPADLTRSTKDKACNLCLLFSVDHHGDLVMTSFNRSNDSIWGILSGANVVHLSMFQEYVACGLGRRCGEWTHVSNNLHVYTENPQWAKVWDAELADRYSDTELPVSPGEALFGPPQMRATFDQELRVFIKALQYAIDTGVAAQLAEIRNYGKSSFIRETAVPVAMAWIARKLGFGDKDMDWANCIAAHDWRVACKHWITRHDGGAK